MPPTTAELVHDRSLGDLLIHRDVVLDGDAPQRAAGFTVTELDAELGTQSADLLAVLDQETWLIEVKAASGAAPEKLVSYLQRHLDKWPQLRPE
ncbi:hypothetical protein OG258_53820 [Streptomyces mirabilis]|uniref:hypothetical protein n=1 Tax=Streptomyces mirabilis TaxID=68239 RepID=UPI002E27DB90|nr:hypothetical protein [Streptomyces mirabilis]